jgi:hypothetical protein
VNGARLYTASITFRPARIMLVLAIRSFRSGMLLLSDVKFVFRVSEGSGASRGAC